MFLRKTKKKNEFILAGLFLSGLVGAGFGSGREIFVYFASFGVVGIVGFILACVTLWFAASQILEIAIGRHFTGVDQIVGFVVKGKRASFYTFSILLFAFIGYVAMLSGIRDVLRPVFPAVCNQFPILFGICTCGIAVAFALAVFYGNFAAYSRVCSIITPAVVLCVATVAVFAAFYAPGPSLAMSFSLRKIPVLLGKSILYTGYNLLFLLGALGRAGSLSPPAREIRKGSLLGAGLFLSCGTCIFFALCIISPAASGQGMPLLSVIGTFGNVPERIFSCVLAVAMLLCAACNFGTVGSVVGKKSFAVPLIALLGIPLSYIGFDRVISRIYPVFGVVGILFLLALAQLRRKIV